MYNTALSAEAQKKQRLLANFADDIAPLKHYLDDPAVTDIYTIGSGEVIIERFSRPKEYSGFFLPPSKVEAIITTCASITGLSIDKNSVFPRVETVIPQPYKIRVTGLLPPNVENPEILFRVLPRQVYPLENYVREGRLKQADYTLICDTIKQRKNILVGGSTGTGKTTFTNAILKKMSEYTPNDRFLIVEDVQELLCPAHDTCGIVIHPRHADEAIRVAMRSNPNRIIFGELRYGQVADELLKAWNTGHSGNVSTIHADTSASMIRRVEDLLREVIPGTLPDVSQTIHLCVHLAKTPRGPVIDNVLRTSKEMPRSSQ
jgi:type IV secretion system protein VirB11